MVFDFEGDCAIITGASSVSGIGFSTARLLAEQGARVVLTGTSERVQDRASELRAMGFEATAWQGDLTLEGSVQDLIRFTLTQFGQIDILINNAGMTSVHSPAVESGESNSAAEIELAEWRAAIARNLDTAFLSTKYALPALRHSARGRVVMVTSVTGPLMAMRNEAAYAAAKAGMVGLMRSLAVDEAQYGICVNAVAPGWIATGSQLAHEVVEGSRVPLQRSAKPEEVAAAILFLASREASYITGQVLAVDGGNTVGEERVL